jgi:hypothetical protein
VQVGGVEEQVGKGGVVQGPAAERGVSASLFAP